LKLEQKISTAYDSVKGAPYHLHAIINHEGNAQSGHYYSYVRDHSAKPEETKNWFRFSDLHIK
jgi:ubiquitin carboxyl-terminal hydrolase 25/28